MVTGGAPKNVVMEKKHQTRDTKELHKLRKANHDAFVIIILLFFNHVNHFLIVPSAHMSNAPIRTLKIDRSNTKSLSVTIISTKSIDR